MSRLLRIATIGLFLALGMTSGSLAQNAANQVSNVHLTLVGTTALDTPTSGSAGSTDRWVKRTPEFDLAVARRSAMTGAAPAAPLQIPSPAPSPIVNAGQGLFGFSGLTHLDQRIAGTGAFTNTQFSTEPPDQGLAVGGPFVLEAVNTALAVYDKGTGKRLAGPTAINQFFKLAPEFVRPNGPFGDFTSDPKCYFDPQTQRWFVTILQIDVDPPTGNLLGHSSVLLAVSRTPDPTAGFNIFKLDTTDDGSHGTQSHPGCPCFGDQPLIGADRNGFYISTNEFPIFVNGFNGAQIYAMSKPALAAGTLPTVVHLSGLPLAEGIAFTIQPATSPKGGEDAGDDGSGVEFFLSDLDFTGTLDNRIAVWALTNTRSLAVPTPNVHLAKVILTSEVYGQPPDARQRNGPRPLADAIGGAPLELLASNDDRMNQVVFADGKLWSGVNTILRTGGQTHVGIAFFVVEPSLDDGKLKAKIENQGYVAVRGEDVIFPSIGVNADGKGAMTFTLSGPDFFPSAAFVPMTDEGAGSVRIAGAGAFPEDGFSGYAGFGGNGTARWGDYSAAVADADGSIWMAAEFIPNKPRTVLANWGTFIARIRADDSED